MQSIGYDTDVTVIGGGIAGLATAALVAREGKRVLLFEQSREIGGRARTNGYDGFYFNLGPHALYRGGRAIEVLRELGIEPAGRVPSPSGAFAVKGGVKYTFPAGFLSLLTTSLFGLAAKLEAARFLGSAAKLDPAAVRGESLRDWLDAHFSQPDARKFVEAVFRVTTYVNAPEIMSAGAAIEQLKLALAKNVMYLDGGWQTLVAGLRKAAETSGVIIETGVKVEAVERDPAGAVQAVRLADGRVYKTSDVVIAASPRVAASIMDRSHSPALQRWADEAIAVRAACLDLGLKRLPDPKATFALGIDRPFYLSVHSATARLAPGEGAMIHVAKYLPPDHDDPPEAVERELERILDLVQPGWRDCVAHRRFLPDMIVTNDFPTARRKGLEGRPGPEVPDVRGLYVVGDWVGKVGMLADAALASASATASMIADCRLRIADLREPLASFNPQSAICNPQL